ncbi:MAG: CHAT domain-containing protein [Saprospirales bacterium]|nr:CHAT domain-containing protein [Saprospirales bacterium]
MDKPYFLMTFANDKPGRLLRGVAEERDAISEALSAKEEFCELKFISAINTDMLVEELCKKKPTILHYGGHAEGEVLFFNSSQNQGIQAEALASFLGHFGEIELVFLNGCATFDFGAPLLEVGVRHVITTHAEIDDEAAVAFARHFYQQLGEGQTVPDAFAFAQDAVKMRFGGADTRGFNTSGFWKTAPAENRQFPWHLENSARDGKQTPWRWEEPEEEAMGAVVSGKLGGPGLEGVEIRRGKHINTSSDSNGNFELRLKYSWIGKKIDIEAKKPQYEVVNREALTIFPEKDRDPDQKLVEIIMCPEGKRSIYASEYYSIAIQEGIGRSSNTLQEKSNINEYVSSIADQLKSLEIEDSSEQTLKAFQYLGKGQIQSAIDALKEEELIEEMKEVLEIEKALQTRKRICWMLFC